MTNEILSRIVEDSWTALESEQTSGERRLRVNPLPVDSQQGPLMAAVDHDGYRHLLVPIQAHQKIRLGLDGPVLHLGKRPLEDENTYQNYADLGCLRHDFKDLFTDLCVDVVGAARRTPENPVKALYGVLDRWKALFRTQGAPLGPSQVAGLFGELMVLKQLLEEDPSAHRLWRGPDGYRHDFWAVTTAVEVKASTSSEGRRPRIHGLDQLEAPEGGTLWLAWIRLRAAAAAGVGTGFVELIEQTLNLCDDEDALIGLLLRAGYRPADADRYQDVRFVVSEELWYQVGPGFPGLTGETLATAGIAVSVLDVEYTIDLTGESPAPSGRDQVRLVKDRLIQESV
ncbi:PD-(D/E)XK motif protein [Streptomyces sp. NBC_01102]|uniref:PD-(D/E)XK motif protein n=1 Tax=Streptomyces sp. NBC_01102 TaxID=2903749 RepID=UPI00386EC1EE|nr:PD-(D/E)XK motif protein [Streptomyces sp. NBC_01102]